MVQVGREKIEMTFTGEVPEGTFQFKVKGQTTEGYLIEQITEPADTTATGPAKSDSSGVDATLLDELPPELKQAVARLLAGLVNCRRHRRQLLSSSLPCKGRIRTWCSISSRVHLTVRYRPTLML